MQSKHVASAAQHLTTKTAHLRCHDKRVFLPTHDACQPLYTLAHTVTGSGRARSSADTFEPTCGMWHA